MLGTSDLQNYAFVYRECPYQYFGQNPKYSFGSHICSLLAMFMSTPLKIFVFDTSNFTHVCIYVLCILTPIIWTIPQVLLNWLLYAETKQLSYYSRQAFMCKDNMAANYAILKMLSHVCSDICPLSRNIDMQNLNFLWWIIQNLLNRNRKKFSMATVMPMTSTTGVHDWNSSAELKMTNM